MAPTATLSHQQNYDSINKIYSLLSEKNIQDTANIVYTITMNANNHQVVTVNGNSTQDGYHQSIPVIHIKIAECIFAI